MQANSFQRAETKAPSTQCFTGQSVHRKPRRGSVRQHRAAAQEEDITVLQRMYLALSALCRAACRLSVETSGLVLLTWGENGIVRIMLLSKLGKTIHAQMFSLPLSCGRRFLHSFLTSSPESPVNFFPSVRTGGCHAQCTFNKGHTGHLWLGKEVPI